MDIHFPTETYKAVQKRGAKSPIFHEEEPYRGIDVESQLIMAEDYPLIKKVVKDGKLWPMIENRRIFRAIENIEKVAAGDAKVIKVKTLQVLEEALRDAIGKTKRKFIFVQQERWGNVLVPYFVRSVEFTPGDMRSQARTRVELVALHRGKKDDGYGEDSITFHRDDLRGDTVETILERKQAFIETPELLQDYDRDHEAYAKIHVQTGEQYLARGIANKDGDGKWSRETENMLRAGQPSKVVIDDQENYGSHTAHISTTFWSKRAHKDDDEEVSQDYQIPVHPIMRVFGLWQQEFYTIHVSNLERYHYNATMADRIVLPAGHKRLIEALTVGTVEKMDDVVKGKASGVIITCTGKPGTGKTLSAEVYSEVAKRPLYTVQCSQLGTDPGELEKNLSMVLERANRWGAILLIDEADVYIHERGSDVNQNAIVGVFLRLLEYYNGILFMNTNREEVIDDAIMSRATAHLKYELPDDEAARRIWEILISQYRVDLSKTEVEQCLRAWPGISGRSIRQIVRLGRMIADREKEKTRFGHLEFAAKFQDLEWIQKD